MSKINASENKELIHRHHVYRRNYAWLFSEKSNDCLNRIIDVMGLMEDLLGSKGEVDADNMVCARQMTSLFSILYGELELIKMDLYEPGGIFSQNDIQTGLELVRGCGAGSNEDNNGTDGNH